MHSNTSSNVPSSFACDACTWTVGVLGNDVIYVDAVKPLMYACATILPLGYLVGIFFTLKTHSHIYQLLDQEKQLEKQRQQELAQLQHQQQQQHQHQHQHQQQEQQQQTSSSEEKHEGDPNQPEDTPSDQHSAEGHEEAGGHEAPEWGRPASIFILLIAAITFGLLAEQLVHAIEPVIHQLGISPRFFGLTFIALVTSTIEFLNAILFAYHDNLSLAFEIANSYCVQVALIQMPALVFINGILMGLPGHPLNELFTLVFPVLDLFSVIIGLFILNYVSFEGKSNYFIGVALIFIYVIMISAFWFAPYHATEEPSTEGSEGGSHHRRLLLESIFGV